MPGPSRGLFRPIRLAAATLLFLLAANTIWWLLGRNQTAATTPPGSEVRVVAHRGGASIAPENTLAALEAALSLGVDAIEIDVRLSSDGVPVLMHDATVDRTTDGEGGVAGMTRFELHSLDAGGWFGRGFTDEPVPTLDEAIVLVDGRAELLVEIKGGEVEHRGITAAVVAVIHRHGATPWCWLLSFHDTVLDSAAILAPDLRRAKLAVGPLPVPGLWFDHRLRVGIPGPRTTVAAMGLNRHFVHGALSDRLRARGVEVWIWTLEDAESIGHALRHGADALITDDPGAALEVLGRRLRKLSVGDRS